MYLYNFLKKYFLNDKSVVVICHLCFRTIFNSELFQSNYKRISLSLRFIMHEIFYIMQSFMFQGLHYKDLLLYFIMTHVKRVKFIGGMNTLGYRI